VHHNEYMEEIEKISFRPLLRTDYDFHQEMLYQAIYLPEGAPPLPREIIRQPEIYRYIEKWGRAHDLGFIAMAGTEQKPVGAVWIRLYSEDNRGYGYVNDLTPELSIAVLPEYRGRGVGTKLIRHMLDAVGKNYQAISLSVIRENPAVRLYRRFGFESIMETKDSITMVKHFI